MEEKRKKFFPQDAKPVIKKAAQKTGRSSFQARKSLEFHQGTPASECISIRNKFDIYVDEYYNITDNCRKGLWIYVSEQMLSDDISNLAKIIDSYLESIEIFKIHSKTI